MLWQQFFNRRALSQGPNTPVQMRRTSRLKAATYSKLHKAFTSKHTLFLKGFFKYSNPATIVAFTHICRLVAEALPA